MECLFFALYESSGYKSPLKAYEADLKKMSKSQIDDVSLTCIKTGKQPFHGQDLMKESLT